MIHFNQMIDIAEPLQERYSFAKFPDAWVFGFVIIASFLWRFIINPWDIGGFLFQIIISVMWLAYLMKSRPAFSYGSPLLMRLTVLPLGAILLFGPIYFAVQGFLYVVLFACGWMLISVLFSFSIEFLGLAPSSGLFLLLGGGLLYFGVPYFSSFESRELAGIHHIITIYRLRNLDVSVVKQLEFACLAEGENRPLPYLRIETQEEIGKIIVALRETMPFTPNHESIHEARQVRIVLGSGEVYNFKLGRGTRSYPQTAWIEFEVEAYENAELYRVLTTELNLPIWARCQ